MSQILELSGQRVSRKRKQELGILPRQVIKRYRRLRKDGEISRDMSSAEVAAVIGIDIASDEDFHDEWEPVLAEEVDWDALLKFIEGLVELFMKILPLLQ